MSDAAETLAALLVHAETAALQLDAAGELHKVHGDLLLSRWISDGTEDRALPLERDALLARVFGPRHAGRIRDALGNPHDTQLTHLDLGVLPARYLRGGVPAHYFAVSLLSLPEAAGAGRLVVLRDATQQQVLMQELLDARGIQEAALAVLRAPPDALRLFLGSAMASVSAIRATLRMPARNPEALRDKLGRLRTEAASLRAEAEALGLSPLLQCCEALADTAAELQGREALRGDDLLPLAPRIDTIASAIGTALRIEEQRYEPPPAATEEPARRTRRSVAWHEVSERRWSEFLRRRGEEIGTLARLTMSGAQQVPALHRRHVDEILGHLLRNALDHGIETPEERLATGKSAAGHVTISFTAADDGGLKMSVHDDGRGFDLSRIGRAAVQSGLLTDESLVRREAGDLVGLIFNPGFTTEGMDDEGQGRGMSYLRRKITRLGGQIGVATKPGRYTLFTIALPEPEQSEEPASASHVMP